MDKKKTLRDIFDDFSPLFRPLFFCRQLSLHCHYPGNLRIYQDDDYREDVDDVGDGVNDGNVDGDGGGSDYDVDYDYCDDDGDGDRVNEGNGDGGGDYDYCDGDRIY